MFYHGACFRVAQVLLGPPPNLFKFTSSIAALPPRTETCSEIVGCPAATQKRRDLCPGVAESKALYARLR